MTLFALYHRLVVNVVLTDGPCSSLIFFSILLSSTSLTVAGVTVVSEVTVVIIRVLVGVLSDILVVVAVILGIFIIEVSD